MVVIVVADNSKNGNPHSYDITEANVVFPIPEGPVNIFDGK